MKKILILGKEGQIGWELERVLSSLGLVIALNRSQVDLNHPHSLIGAINSFHPDIVINAAAYTAVDKAEKESDLAKSINGIAPGILAEEVKKIGGLLVHYSTDYVFNGESKIPYKESDETDPQNVYGKTKLMGEKAIQEVGGNYIILRTSWVYGSRGTNFFLTMLKLAKDRKILNIVNDQIGSPTWSRFIAQATAQILLCPFKKSEIYHLTSSEAISWHGFAENIFAFIREKNSDLNIPVVKAIPSSEYPTTAKRPFYSVLDNTKCLQNFGFCLPSWKKGLELCMQEFNWN